MFRRLVPLILLAVVASGSALAQHAPLQPAADAPPDTTADVSGWDVSRPLPTDTTRDRSSLVTLDIDGQTYAIADIGLRMLTPRERFRAQGFPDSYEIEEGEDEYGNRIPLSQAAQGRMCGNSVCPPLAEALVRANVPELAVAREAAE